MGAYKDKNGTWYAQFRFTNWKGEPDRKTKRGFATKKEALDWERDFLTQSAGNLEMTFEAFYELYKKNLQDRLKKSTCLPLDRYGLLGSCHRKPRWTREHRYYLSIRTSVPDHTARNG